MKKYQKWLFPVLAIACMLAACFFPLLYLPLLTVGSLCFAVAIIQTNSAVIPLIAVFAFIGMLVFTGSIAQALFSVMTFVPIGAALGTTYRRKSDIGGALLISLLLTGFLTLLIFCAYIMEVSPTFSVQDALTPFRENLTGITNEIYNNVVLNANLFDANTLRAVLAGGRESFADSVFTALIYQMPIILSVAVMAITFIDYYWLKWLLRRLGADTAFMTSFDKIRISKAGAAVYALALLLYLMLSMSSPGSSAATVLYVFADVLGVALSVCGLSVADYLLRRRTRLKNAVRRLLIAALLIAGIFLPLLFNILALAGMIDAYYDLRRKIDGGETA